MSLTDHKIQNIIDYNGGHFKPMEFGENRHNLNAYAVRRFIEFRSWHGMPTYISSAWRGDDGAHKLGAFDAFLYNDYEITQPEPGQIWRILTTWPWWGAGIYFDTHAFDNPAIMIHVDVMDYKEAKQMNKQRPLRWIRKDGAYYYQNTKTGGFWSQENQEMTTLEEEITKYKANSD